MGTKHGDKERFGGLEDEAGDFDDKRKENAARGGKSAGTGEDDFGGLKDETGSWSDKPGKAGRPGGGGKDQY